MANREARDDWLPPPYEAGRYLESPAKEDVRMLTTPSSPKEDETGQWRPSNSPRHREKPATFEEVELRQAQEQEGAAEAPRRRASAVRTLVRVWYWEILSAVLSFLSLLGILTILGVRDQRPIPDWPRLVTINSLISAFTVVFKASLLLPVVECLGQLKWSQLAREPHSLADVERLDAAGRGPMGAVYLLFGWTGRATGRVLPTLGALLVLFAFAIEPFSQAVIDFRSCQRAVLNDVARIPKSNRWDWINYNPNDTSNWFETNFLAGLLTPPANTSTLLNIHCPTGNCTFPADKTGASFQTLAMCYSCEDTSSLIQQVNGSASGQYRLPPYDRQMPGLTYTQFFVPPIPEINHRELKDVSSFMTFSGAMLNYPEFNDTVGCLRSNQSTGFENCSPKPFGFTCSITPCIKTYAASMQSFVYNETEISREMLVPSRLPTLPDWDTNPDFQIWAGSYPMYSLAKDRVLRNGEWEDCIPGPSRTSDKDIAVNRRNRTLVYNLEGKYGNDTEFYTPECTWLLHSYPYWWTYQWIRSQLSNVSMDDTAVRGNGPLPTSLDPTWAKRLYNRGNASMETVNRLMQGIADTISVYIRQNSHDPDSIRFSTGEVLTSDTCVFVHWAWVAFPVGMLLLGVVFLVATMVFWQRGEWKEDWKSSSLAVLYQGIDSDARGGRASGPRALRQGEVWKASRDVKVVLRGDGREWRFVRAKSG